MTYELHCGLSDLEKAIVVSYSSAFINEESGNTSEILETIIDILEYSFNDYQRNLHTVETMVSMLGLNLLNTLKNVSAVDKSFIKQAIDYAYNNGGDRNLKMYNVMLSTLGISKKR